MRLGAYLASVALVGVATSISYFVFGITSYASLPLIYLIAIVLSAQRYGLWPSIMASVLSVLAWDYFFTLPYFDLAISDERDLFALIIFLIVALLVSGMTANIQQQNKQLAQLASKNAQLYAFSQNLATIGTIETIESFSASYLSAMLKRDVIIILNDRLSGAPIFSFPPNAIQNDNDKLTYLDLAAEIQISEFGKILCKEGFHILSAQCATRPHRCVKGRRYIGKACIC